MSLFSSNLAKPQSARICTLDTRNDTRSKSGGVGSVPYRLNRYDAGSNPEWSGPRRYCGSSFVVNSPVRVRLKVGNLTSYGVNTANGETTTFPCIISDRFATFADDGSS